MTDGLALDADHLHVVGAERGPTTIVFEPPTARTLFAVSRGRSIAWRCSIRKLMILGAGNASKTAIDVVDASEFLAEDLFINRWSGGTLSVGMRLRGRELTRVRRVHISADRPVSIEVNPNAPLLSADHFHGEDWYLLCLRPTEACVHIGAGFPLTNFVLDGQQAWVYARYGFYWNQRTSPGISYGIRIENARIEQATDAAGYAIYVAAARTVHGIAIRNCVLSSDRRGIYARNVRGFKLEQVVQFGPLTAPEALNVDGSVADLTIENCFWQDNARAVMNGLAPVFQVPKTSARKPLPATAHYSSAPG